MERLGSNLASRFIHYRQEEVMLRLVVSNRVDGRTIIDSVGPEEVVKLLADKYKTMIHYRVEVTYP